jgi:hypothetical protein
MNNLHFYGPLYPGDGSWNPHPMTLVADYTYQVNVTLDAGAFFLLVNMIAQTPDWKECKLGRGLDETKLEIGGGNIKVPQRGDYTLTYFTPSLLSSARPPMYAGAVPGGFLMAGRNLWPAVTIQTKDFVLQQQRVKLSLVFSSPIAVDAVLRNASAIKVEHADVDNITSVSSTQVDLYILPSELRSEFIIRVSIPEGLTYAETDDPDNPGTMLVGLPTTAAYFSLIYSPPWWRRGTAAWGRLVIMRDPTNRWPVGQPMDGWYVTAIHGNILARTGQVLLTGWGRAEEFACKSAGSRKLGVSFLLDPTDLLNLPKQSQSPSLTYSIAETLQENGRNNSDVLYCSGHAPLRDGRKFYAGGATYLNLGTATEEETGLPYARVWDPLQLNWTQVTADLPVSACMVCCALISQSLESQIADFPSFFDFSVDPFRAAPPGIRPRLVSKTVACSSLAGFPPTRVPPVPTA